MKNFPRIYLVLVVLFIALAGCQKQINRTETKEDTPGANESSSSSLITNALVECGTPVVRDLLNMGGVGTWGTVVISNDENNITVRVNSTEPGMFITKITAVFGSQDHVNTALTTQINWTPCDGPSVWDRKKIIAPQTQTSDSLLIPNSNFQADGCIWIHISVELTGQFGTLGCAYPDPGADGVLNGSAQWQSSFKYCRQDCPPPPPPPGDCGPLRTQTPGGWGAEPNGNNAGTYLHANFAAAFPGGLQVGCYPNNYYVSLTTAQAITNLLPTGGQANALTMNYTDPPAIKNVLVGHLVALTLSTGFDVVDPNFGEAGITLGQMVIGSGTFANWTVADFLAEANKVLGGCSTSYTPAQVLETATAINENYVDGKIDNGFLDCPDQVD
jgi:hypothetical protein